MAIYGLIKNYTFTLGSAELTDRYVLFTMHYLEVSWS